MKRFTVFLLLSFIFNCAYSSQIGHKDIQNIKITRTMMSTYYGQKLYIQVNGTPVRSEGHCHDSDEWDYVFDTSTEIGKHMLSRLLLAEAAQKNVEFAGNDSCDLHDRIEELVRVEIF